MSERTYRQVFSGGWEDPQILVTPIARESVMNAPADYYLHHVYIGWCGQEDFIIEVEKD